MQVEVSMKDKKKAERRYQEYLKKMNKKKGEQTYFIEKRLYINNWTHIFFM